jgi:hypothetical protein
MNKRISDQQLITIALLPFAAATAIYTMWANGFVFDLPFSVSSTLGTPNLNLGWLDNAFHPIQLGGSVMVAFIGVLVVGFFIVTWLTMVAVDVAKKTREKVEQVQESKRGAVTGLVRPTQKHAWSSAHDLDGDDVEGHHYSPRVNGWVRQQFGESQDKVSGALTK